MQGSKKQPTTIGGYIKNFPKNIQIILEKTRQTIRKSAPQAIETMNYGMPTFKLNGKNLVHFATWKTHLGFYPTPSGITVFKKELARYEGAKGSVQFSLHDKIPYDLIKKIVAFRVKQTLNTVKKKSLKLCSRGHKFFKSSDCPVCPKCWVGYYRKKIHNDFPDNLGAPALRALHSAKITKLKQLTKYTEADLLELHGIGPSSIPKLRAALKLKKLLFLKAKNK